MVTKLVSLFVSFLLCGLTLAAQSSSAPVAGQAVEAFPVKDLRPGMKAVGYSVFEGKKVAAFAVEILGVLKNVWGPGQHIILARLGDRVEKTGVASGMSGSPVYLKGKLVGAISLRVGVFAHEPIAGITPAELMLGIKELDESKSPGATLTAGQEVALPAELQELLKPERVSGPSPDAFLVPIETPLAFTGFHDEVLQQFGGVFQRLGVTPVQGERAARCAIPNRFPTQRP